MKSNNCYMLFALTDGTVMMYTTSNRNVGSGVNFLTFEGEDSNTADSRVSNSENKARKSRFFRSGFFYFRPVSRARREPKRKKNLLSLSRSER